MMILSRQDRIWSKMLRQKNRQYNQERIILLCYTVYPSGLTIFKWWRSVGSEEQFWCSWVKYKVRELNKVSQWIKNHSLNCAAPAQYNWSYQKLIWLGLLVWAQTLVVPPKKDYKHGVRHAYSYSYVNMTNMINIECPYHSLTQLNSRGTTDPSKKSLRTKKPRRPLKVPESHQWSAAWK